MSVTSYRTLYRLLLYVTFSAEEEDKKLHAKWEELKEGKLTWKQWEQTHFNEWKQAKREKGINWHDLVK